MRQLPSDLFSRDAYRQDPARQAFMRTLKSLGEYTQSNTRQFVEFRIKRQYKFKATPYLLSGPKLDIDDNAVPVGIKTSVVMAWIIYKSEFGQHPLAQPRFNTGLESPTWQHGNNLLLLETDNFWHDDVIDFEGKKFRSFKGWGIFAKHLVELLSWSNTYMRMFWMTSTADQLKQIAMHDEDPDSAHGILWKAVRTFHLEQFDSA